MKIVFLISIVTIVACASTKKQGTEFSGKVQIHQPYCGGAKPSPEVAKGTYSPYKSATFLIKTSMSNDEKNIVAKITTDEKGEFKANLKPGSYVVIHQDKTLSF